MRSLALLVLSLTLCLPAVPSFAAEGPLAHMVFFRLHENTPKNRQRLIDACQKHLRGHDGVLHFSAGARAEDLNREVNDQVFDVALHLVFRDKRAHDKYQTHARHLQFIEENKSLWSNVRVFDSYLPLPQNKKLTSLDEVLQAKIDVRIEQQSLGDAFATIETRLRRSYKVASDVKFSIDARALQFDGITRNMMVRELVLRQSSVADVLTALVRKANPTANLASPADVRQKLVWAVDRKDGGIVITTRQVAKARASLELPKVFEPASR